MLSKLIVIFSMIYGCICSGRLNFYDKITNRNIPTLNANNAFYASHLLYSNEYNNLKKLRNNTKETKMPSLLFQ